MQSDHGFEAGEPTGVGREVSEFVAEYARFADDQPVDTLLGVIAKYDSADFALIEGVLGIFDQDEARLMRERCSALVDTGILAMDQDGYLRFDWSTANREDSAETPDVPDSDESAALAHASLVRMVRELRKGIRKDGYTSPLHALLARDGWSVPQIAVKCGIPTDEVREDLEQLIDVGIAVVSGEGPYGDEVFSLREHD